MFSRTPVKAFSPNSLFSEQFSFELRISFFVSQTSLVHSKWYIALALRGQGLEG